MPRAEPTFSAHDGASAAVSVLLSLTLMGSQMYLQDHQPSQALQMDDQRTELEWYDKCLASAYDGHSLA